MIDLYNRQVTDNYDCMNFVVDVLARKFDGNFDYLLESQGRRQVKLLSHPQEGCVVAIRSKVDRVLHFGVWLERKVLHLSLEGVFAEPLSDFVDFDFKFYECPVR